MSAEDDILFAPVSLTMSAFILMILCAAALTESGAVVKPVVSFSSNFGKIFTEETVTLTCNVNSRYLGYWTYSWYKNNQKMDRNSWGFTIQSARSDDSGDYSCEISDSDRSDPLTLQVSKGQVLLQTSPSPVYEGDTLTLMCHHRPGYFVTSTTFYKGNQILESQYRDYFHLPQVDKTAAGTYKCSKNIMVYEKRYRDSSDIAVRELFSDPEINVSPYVVTEDADVTLTCDTRLAPSRAQTDLRFAFYKNSQKVQEFGKSNLHTINSVQLQDAGNYTCEVTTQTSSVRKTSKGMDIKITGSALKPAVFLSLKWGKIFTAESVTLACNMESTYQGNGTYSWYKDDKKIDGEHRVYTIQSARLEDSGDYTCELSDTDRSDPLTLWVSDGMVLLQSSPSPVYEGETLTLRCHHRGGYTMQSSTFYKGSQVMESFYGDSFYLVNVDKTAAGMYTCRKRMRAYYNPFADSVNITVKELFTDPDVIVTPYLLTVGDTMDMTCHTRLAPLRAHTELHFTFYRNGEKVQDFGISSRYKITSIQMRDSGNYTCEVRTVIGHVKKTSRGTNIEIGVPVNGARIRADRDNLEMVAGDNVTFICWVERVVSPFFLWLHNGKEVVNQSDVYQIRESGKTLYIESVASHHGGTYQCKASDQVSTDRTFSAESNILTISVSEKRTSGFPAFLIPTILPVLLLILSILIFTFRHKICPRPEPTGVRDHEVPLGITDAAQNDPMDQSDSEEPPLQSRNLPSRDNRDGDDVCYSYINTRAMPPPGSSALSTKTSSVIYSAVKFQNTTGEA